MAVTKLVASTYSATWVPEEPAESPLNKTRFCAASRPMKSCPDRPDEVPPDSLLVTAFDPPTSGGF